MWQHKSCNQSLYHTLFIIGKFTVKQWQKTAAFRGTCRINLWKWKYQFTLESLPQPNNSNSYRTPHCKHRSMVRISEWLRDCTTLFSFLDPRSSIIETQDSILASWDSILASRNSKRSSLETQGSSYEFQGSSVNLLLSGTVSIILYNFYTWLKKHRRLRSIHHRQGGFKDLWVYMLTSKANSFITSLHCHELLVWMQIPGVLCLRHTIVFLCSLPRKLLGPILCFQVCVSDIPVAIL